MAFQFNGVSSVSWWHRPFAVERKSNVTLAQYSTIARLMQCEAVYVFDIDLIWSERESTLNLLSIKNRIIGISHSQINVLAGALALLSTVITVDYGGERWSNLRQSVGPKSERFNVSANSQPILKWDISFLRKSANNSDSSCDTHSTLIYESDSPTTSGREMKLISIGLGALP